MSAALPLSGRLSAYWRLTRMHRPIGILLLLWPTLWGLWMASGGSPDPEVLLVFVAGTVLMRAAGCAINDYADRDIDPHVKRTTDRPLAAREIAPVEALAVAAALSLVAFLLVLRMNALTVGLSFAALGLAATYPFTKRFLAIPQAYLGIAFGFGIPMAFAAQTGAVPALAWWLLAANAFWAIAYDTEYAMVDRDDDVKIGVKSSALTFGRLDVAAVMVCHGVLLAMLAAAGATLGLGVAFHASLAVAAGLALYQYRLIRGRERDPCFRAFLHNNWLGAAIFAGLALDYLLRG